MDNGYLMMRNRARRFRKKPTLAEAKVWAAIRRDACNGLRFRRQEVMGQYIADFYCAEIRLILEIDGSIHDTKDQQERDRWRDEAMIERGLWVLRLRNEFVLQATHEQIRRTLQTRIATQK